MKKIVILIIALLFSSVAHAEQLKFVWSYDDPSIIDGFRLYRDGQIVDTDNIAPTAVTVTTERQTDKKSHVYHLVAFLGEEESGPSETAIDEYSHIIQAVGNLTIEVIK